MVNIGRVCIVVLTGEPIGFGRLWGVTKPGEPVLGIVTKPGPVGAATKVGDPVLGAGLTGMWV